MKPDKNPTIAAITDTRHSPFAALKPVAIGDVSLEAGFWKSRQQINQGITIKSQYALLESTGRLDNFRRAAGKLDKPYQGFVYNDSDVYKWLEAASWTLISSPGGELHEMVEDTINLIAAAQQKDGYINTYFSLNKAAERWTDLLGKHELYCAGHLIQAAVAHYRVTGNEKLLDVVIRLADHIYSTFGPHQREMTGGHPEIEMALVELYRTTHEPKYLDLAALFINRRGYGLLDGSEYLVDHTPLRNMNHLAGHAVRALYLCAGAADLALETGETLLIDALNRLWSNMVHQQIYVNGGAGSRYDGEAFGAPFELPNTRAYAETCAAIASVMWNWRMLLLQGDARFADLLEWTLYNGVLPGISLDGRQYFYVNPL
ncbi:MAG TPA: beta-L-arabinofuranosidase domain-containing protein, partial [Anaerolineales bacterium]